MGASSTKKKRPRRWVSASASTTPDPRVPRNDPEYGKWRVDRIVAVDSEGDLWDFVLDLPPAKLSRPPEE